MDNLFAQLAGTVLPPQAILLICATGSMEPVPKELLQNYTRVLF